MDAAPQPQVAPLLRMADLVTRIGVSAQTIRYYANQGLLPAPKKTARNMAWYGEQHIERVELIRALQQDHFLPLRAIHAVLHDSDEYPLTPHQRALFALARRQIEAKRQRRDTGETPEQVATAVGLSDTEVEELRACRMLSDRGDDPTGDATVIRLWSLMRANGLTAERGFHPRDLALIHNVVDVLFNHEIRLFSERMGGLPTETMSDVIGKVVPAITQLIGVLNERRITQFAARFKDDYAAEQEKKA